MKLLTNLLTNFQQQPNQQIEEKEINNQDEYSINNNKDNQQITETDNNFRGRLFSWYSSNSESSISMNEEVTNQLSVITLDDHKQTTNSTLDKVNKNNEKHNTNDQKEHDNSLNQNQKKQKQYQILFQEYQMLKENPPYGIYIFPSLEEKDQKNNNNNDNNIILLNGIIFVKSLDFYEGGIFEFHIELPSDYNDMELVGNSDTASSCYPHIYFKTPLFHPLVKEETGELNIKGFIPIWDPKEHTLRDVQKFMVYMFQMEYLAYDSSDEDCLNINAKYLYDYEPSVFADLTLNCVAQSIRISEENESVYGLKSDELALLNRNQDILQTLKDTFLTLNDDMIAQLPDGKITDIVIKVIQELKQDVEN